MSVVRVLVCVLLFMGATVVEARNLQFDQTAEVEGRALESKVKVKEDAFRIEMQAEGMQAVVIQNEDGLYNVLVDQGVAMKIPASEDSDDFELLENIQDFDAYLEAEAAQKVGEEEFDGQLCDIYTIESNASKVWVSQELRFPLKVEAGGQAVLFSNIEQDVEFSDEDFSLPEGVQVIDLEGIDMSQVFAEPGEPALAP